MKASWKCPSGCNKGRRCGISQGSCIRFIRTFADVHRQTNSWQQNDSNIFRILSEQHRHKMDKFNMSLRRGHVFFSFLLSLYPKLDQVILGNKVVSSPTPTVGGFQWFVAFCVVLLKTVRFRNCSHFDDGSEAWDILRCFLNSSTMAFCIEQLMWHTPQS